MEKLSYDDLNKISGGVDETQTQYHEIECPSCHLTFKVSYVGEYVPSYRTCRYCRVGFTA